jgi:phospholipid/cholesterol/gamma-HCH transport system ATP-binding protein
MVTIRNLHKSFDGQWVLRGVNLEVAQGEILVVIGRSGEGKSVLLKHLMGRSLTR